MNKYTDFKSIELVLDKSNPYVIICYELINDSQSRLSYLVSLTGLQQTDLLRYFCWIGTYGFLKSIVEDISDNEIVKEDIKLAYKNARGAFTELNKISKTTLTWEQANCLATGITILEVILHEISVESELKNLSKIEQYEIFKKITKNITRANFLIGHAMSDISEIKAKNQIKKMASTGGKAKANNYNTKMDPIFDDVFDLFQKGDPRTGEKWRFKADCVRYYMSEYYNQPYDPSIKLDKDNLVAAITTRINDRSASRKPTLLAESPLC